MGENNFHKSMKGGGIMFFSVRQQLYNFLSLYSWTCFPSKFTLTNDTLFMCPSSFHCIIITILFFRTLFQRFAQLWPLSCVHENNILNFIINWLPWTQKKEKYIIRERWMLVLCEKRLFSWNSCFHFFILFIIITDSKAWRKK